MKKYQLIFALCCLYSVNAFSARRLVEISSSSLCSKKRNLETRVHYALDFNGERLAISSKADFFRNTLFVGTDFVIQRSPVSFNNKNLLNARGIGQISESRISNFRVVDGSESEAYFESNKKLPFFMSLKCSNRVKVVDWSEYKKTRNNVDLVAQLEKNQCFSDLQPFKVTDQEVFDCNDHFSKSRIVTFYYEVSPRQTRVLTLSFSELTSKPNLITRNVMKGEVKKSLRDVADTIEGLGQ